MHHRTFFYWDLSVTDRLGDLCNTAILVVSEVSAVETWRTWNAKSYVNSLMQQDTFLFL